MLLRLDHVIWRMPEPGHIDEFFKSVGISFLLHVIVIAGMFIYSSLEPAIRKLPEPEAYVVHLMDPGKFKIISRPAEKKRRKRVERMKTPPVKSIVKPKKLVPMASKDHKPVVKKEVVEQKVIEHGGKKTDRAAQELEVTKKGGMIDIKRFPYEWYLKVMESKIYRNWDTFSVKLNVSQPVRVTVYFLVDRLGKIRKPRVEESSMDLDIDRSALEAVKSSAPLPPLPSGYKDEYLEVYFGFTLETNR
ncbi:MAG: hypothetical protein IEMM0002_1337 [bacterium]|nr:MAG: hypothetical protein IEMM0002_1337 [bacterium]